MANTFNLIDSRTLLSDTANVIFSSIPQTYNDLVLRISAKGNRNSYAEDLKVEINSNSGTYSNVRLYGSAGGLGSDGGTGASYTYVGLIAGATDMASTFSGTELVFPNYSSSTMMKSYHATGGAPIGSTTNWQIGLGNGQTTSTSPITSITLSSYNGTLLLTNSTFFLYGLKNS